jgi:DNA-directed RNA polymerase subunit RPC12/RpoP
MYAVVGCSDCSALWVIEGRSDTTQCPRCGSRRKYEKRRQFVTTDDEAHAREVRASMLANRQDEGEAFAELDAYADLEARVEAASVDDETYLDRSGVDVDAVAEAGERASEGEGGSDSRPEVVRAALRERDRPDTEAVVEYASDRGIPPDATRRVLERLRERGEVVDAGGGLRLL